MKVLKGSLIHLAGNLTIRPLSDDALPPRPYEPVLAQCQVREYVHTFRHGSGRGDPERCQCASSMPTHSTISAASITSETVPTQ